MQASDGQCHCALNYRATHRGDACELKIYEICKDGQARDQYGKCLDHKQWKHLCSHEVSTESHVVKSEPAITHRALEMHDCKNNTSYLITTYQ